MRLWKFALPVLVLATGVTPAQGVSDQTVSYRGYQVTVPASWPVVDLTKDPTACVRYDRPAVYLGTSTAQANCPAHLAGRSVGIVLEPLTKSAHSTDGEIQVAVQDAGVLATAYYAPGGEQSARKVLSTGQVTSKSAGIAQPKAQAVTPSIVATGALTGLAFDTCTAPSQSAMDAWWSPATGNNYKAVGIYISGGLRACGQPNLTQDWVVANTAKGWQFLLIDVGLQAPCSTLSSKMSADPATARSQGRTAAANAVSAAQALGFTQRSAIYSDIEAYPSTAACKAAVLSYLSGWTIELNSRGYVGGAYVGASSGARDLNTEYNNIAYTRPDNLWFARWNNKADTTDDGTYVSPTNWTNSQRAHQYAGNQSETINGVTMNIDRNAVKLTPPPAALTAFTGTGAYLSASLRWTVPAGTALGQVVVRRNTGTTPPALPNVGTAVYAGTAGTTTATGLANATSYAFRAWVKDSTGKFGPPTDLRLTGTGSTISASSASIPYTGSATIYSRVTRVDTTSVVGVPMVLYSRPKNSTTWSQVATATSSSTGSASAVVKPTASTVYVWGYNGSSTLLGSRSGNYTVEVRPTITAYLSAAAIKLGATTTYYGYLRPQHPGTTVYLQRQSGTSWPTVTTTKLNTTGNYAFSIKPTARGTFNYRAVWLADADHATTVSATKTVTVS